MTAPHAHRWRIETPSGPTVLGVCRLCGAERLYLTAGQDSADSLEAQARLARDWRWNHLHTETTA